MRRAPANVGRFLVLLVTWGILQGSAPAPTSRPVSQPAQMNQASTKPSLPFLYPTAQMVLGQIHKQESRKDATCWTTVRMMEHFYAHKELSEHAALLKIEASKLLVYELWRLASAWSTNKILKASDFENLLPGRLRGAVGLLQPQGVAKDTPLYTKVRDYNKVTENWRMILSISMESLAGRGVFAKGVIDISPLSFAAAARLAKASTAMTIELLRLAKEAATKHKHTHIEIQDIQEGYKALRKLVRAAKKGSPPHVVSHRIKNLKLSKKLLRGLVLRNMQNKVKSLRSWNKSVWKGKQDDKTMAKLLSKLIGRELHPSGLRLLKQFLRSKLGAWSSGHFAHKGDGQFTPLMAIHKPTKKRTPRYVTVSQMSNNVNNAIPRETLINGDVIFHLRAQDPRTNKAKYSKVAMTGPALDAVRDVTLHWVLLSEAWKANPHADYLGPFAAELLAERTSELLLYILEKSAKQAKKMGVFMMHSAFMKFQMLDLMRYYFTTSHKQKKQVAHWSAAQRKKKKELLKGYPSPLFVNLNAKGKITKGPPCNTFRAGLGKNHHLTPFGLPLKVTKQMRLDPMGTNPSQIHKQKWDLKEFLPRGARNKKDTFAIGLQIWAGAGIAVGDVDNDGRTDFFIAGEGCNRLYRNLGNYKFQDISEQVRLNDPHFESRQPLFVDVDNDGRLDLFVVHSNRPSKLFMQRKDGTFEETTETSGIKTGIGAHTATFFDYDNDGKLDLYVGVYGALMRSSIQFPSVDGRNGRPNQLFRNLGGGKFQEVTKRAGVGSTAWTMAVTAVDYDRDGHIDLILANDFGRDQVFRNLGNGTFQDVSRQTGMNDRGNGMNVSLTDFNHDGYWDVYISMIDMFSKSIRFILPRANTTIKLDDRILKTSFYLSGNKLFLNQKGKRFQPQEQGIFEPGERGWSWSSNFFDLDNDGDEDLYVVNGYRRGTYVSRQRNQLFLREGQTFYQYDRVSAVTYKETSRSAAVLDLSGTGKMDIITSDLQRWPRILRNLHNNKHRWIKVKLRGTKSNRFGVGASVQIEVKGQPRQMRYVSVGNNYLSQDDTTLHFGLKLAKQVNAITVYWPHGKAQRFKGPFSSNKTHTLKENVR